MFFLSAMYRSSAKPSISVSSLFIFDVMEEGGYFNFRVLVSRFFLARTWTWLDRDCLLLPAF